MYDQGALYNTPTAAAPAYHTPQAMSWADHAGEHLNLSPGDRVWHFAHRARVLSGKVINVNEVTAILDRLSLTRQKTLSKAEVVVRYSATAMCLDVRVGLVEPLIFLANSHHMCHVHGARLSAERL